LLFSCTNRGAREGNNSTGQDQLIKTTAAVDLPAGFLDFYKKFHEDSLYQIAHITWPLQGESSVPVDSTHNEKRLTSWELKNWKMHHLVDFSSGDFRQDFQTVGDVLVIEKIGYRAANFGLERRFALNDKNEWELIFYSDIMELK
jgi:hypothetical protein